MNAAAEPATLSALKVNGSTSIVLPIPLVRVADPSTNASKMVANTLYYQMRIHDVGVYFLDASGEPLGNGPVQVALNKSGLSSFFDQNMALHVFSHNPIAYGTGTFIYDSKTGCPLEESYCGDLCPDYIRYSPFGKWNVQIFDAAQQGVDLTKLDSIRFEFQVDYQAKPGFNPNIFGKNASKYPQNIGKLCAKEHEIRAFDVA